MGIKRASGDSAAARAVTAVTDSSRSRDNSPSQLNRARHTGIPVIGLAAGAIAAAAAFMMITRPAGATTINFTHPAVAASAGLHRPDRHFTALAQDDDDQDAANQVQTKQVAQYVAVYKAMQKN